MLLWETGTHHSGCLEILRNVIGDLDKKDQWIMLRSFSDETESGGSMVICDKCKSLSHTHARHKGDSHHGEVFFSAVFSRPEPTHGILARYTFRVMMLLLCHMQHVVIGCLRILSLITAKKSRDVAATFCCYAVTGKRSMKKTTWHHAGVPYFIRHLCVGG